MNPDAAQRDAEADRALLRAIQGAAQSGDLARAMQLADEALAKGLRHPLTLNLSALKLENEGRLQEAVERLREAVERAPRDVSALNALGLCLHRIENYEEALERFDAVLAIKPNFAPAHCNRGAALEALARLNEAEGSYRRGLDLQPDNPAGLCGMASILSRRGAYADARHLAEKVLRVQPNFPDAVLILAAADIAEGATDAAEMRLRDLLADPRLPPLVGAFAMGALGDALDAQGRADKAFDAYRMSGEALRRIYADRFAGRQSALEAVRSQIAYFENGPPAPGRRKESVRRPGAGGPSHVFLLGFPRSGTTLLEQVLASHPEVEALDERETLVDALRAYLRRPEELDRLAVASEAELAPFREAYWRRVHEAGVLVAGKTFVDKHPLNTLKLPLIARLFPDAKILFARRDPRDVVLSCFRRRFRMSAPYYELLTLEGSAIFYDAAMRLASCVEEELGLSFFVVRHESLVADFEAEVRRICAFISLGWSDSMRDFVERAKKRGIATPSAAQISRGLSAEGIGHWRRYRAQMAPVLPILEPWVEDFGYGGSDE